jgi:formylmethanofuran dehydrogenase subunit E
MPLDEYGEEGADGEAPSDEPTIECSMCHQQVRVSQSVVMSGRTLCFGCAAAWFDEDEVGKDD